MPPDGRFLAHAEWRSSDGRPVLLCPGAATSRPLGLDADAVDAAGVLLASVDRPGLGRSSHHPTRTFSTSADDVAHVVGCERWRAPVGLASSQGGPFVPALAAYGVVGAAALVSAQDNLSGRREDLADHLRGLVDSIAKNSARWSAPWQRLLMPRRSSPWST